jgi:hypothetical protein
MGGRAGGGASGGMGSGSRGGLQSALRSKENAIRNMDVEHSFVFDDKGNIVFSAVGDKHSVSMAGAKDRITLHNHPSGGSFSEKDIQSVLYANEKEMRVVGGNYTYSLKRPTGGWNSSHMKAYKAAVKKINAADAAYQDKYKGDYWTTFRRINRTHEHRVMKEFAKQMGYEYTKTKTK